MPEKVPFNSSESAETMAPADGTRLRQYGREWIKDAEEGRFELGKSGTRPGGTKQP